MNSSDSSAWFAGPKSENGDAFSNTIRHVLEDYYNWRRNYFPEDGIIVDSHRKRENESFEDDFQDRLLELLGRLKADVPFHSPRYAAHMVSEQTLPSIAGYFAAMLYNPNNVTTEAASVTVRLEVEAAQMIARMLGYETGSWAHLTSGGTLANIEALWVARTVKYLPFVVRDMARDLGVFSPVLDMSNAQLLGCCPSDSLRFFAECFVANAPSSDAVQETIAAYRRSPHNVAERGLADVCGRIDSKPVLLISEAHHYSFPKLLDALGIGRRSLVSVRVDKEFSMDLADLADRLDQVEQSGGNVLAVVPIVGTTEEGAIDPVDRILDLRAERAAKGQGSFWIHADAAWGGYLKTITVPNRLGLGTPEADVMVRGEPKRIALQLPERSACDALERLGECDSITVDPHKLGYVPYPAGAICFKSSLVKPLARQDAPYLAERPADPVSESASHAVGVYVLEGSKPGAAAASVWLSHSLIPLDNTGHGRLIQQTVRAASEMHALLLKWPELTGNTTVRALPLCAPGSNVVCYVFAPDRAVGLAEINRLNQNLYKCFSLETGQEESVYRQRFFISRTLLTSKSYGICTVSDFLRRLGVSPSEYEELGVFLLRSVMMNPWYDHAKDKGKFYVSALVDELYRQANLLATQGLHSVHPGPDS